MEYIILEIYESGGNKRAKCRCNCGQIFDVQHKRVIKNLSKNCNKGICKPIVKAMIGRIFGKLTITAYDEKRKMYVCSCLCGGETRATGWTLINGGRKGCQCIKIGKEYLLLPDNLGPKKALFRAYKKAAQARKHEFDLSIEQFCTLIDKNCHYCNLPPEGKYKSGNRFLVYSGIDRIESTKGYEITNCVPCCKICNYSKRILSLNEWMMWLKRISKHQRLNENE